VAIAMGLMLVPMATSAGTARFKAANEDGQFVWRPGSRSIAKGDRIVWTNPTGKAHTVTSYSGSWDKNSVVKPGERTSKRFRKAGTYRFRCTVKGHSALSDGECHGMCGTVVVR
jgi:plastocyanin